MVFQTMVFLISVKPYKEAFVQLTRKEKIHLTYSVSSRGSLIISILFFPIVHYIDSKYKLI
jgi:hypothetical protein